MILCPLTLMGSMGEKISLLVGRKSGETFVIEWKGGRGPYQVQASTDGRTWRNVASGLKDYSLSLPITRNFQLFRVVSSEGNVSNLSAAMELRANGAFKTSGNDRATETSDSRANKQLASGNQLVERDSPIGKRQPQAPQAEVKIGGKVRMKPFAKGVPLWGDSDRYLWKDTPRMLDGFSFSQFYSHYEGVTDFEIITSGTVYLAVTSRWGSGGNSSGGWKEELTTKKEFLDAGWKPITKLSETADDFGHEHRWVLYQKECRAGESYRLRTEKYCKPLLFFKGT
ncbi:MAG: hypothetical protein AAF514_18930 [Verrucomicrobiota bacterium]